MDKSQKEITKEMFDAHMRTVEKSVKQVTKEILDVQSSSGFQVVERAIAIGWGIGQVLEAEGHTAAQDWGMKALKRASAEEIDMFARYWKPETIALMVDRLEDDGRFNELRPARVL